MEHKSGNICYNCDDLCSILKINGILEAYLVSK